MLSLSLVLVSQAWMSVIRLQYVSVACQVRLFLRTLEENPAEGQKACGDEIGDAGRQFRSIHSSGQGILVSFQGLGCIERFFSGISIIMELSLCVDFLIYDLYANQKLESRKLSDNT